MPNNQRRGGHNKESSSNGKPVTAVATEAITNRLNSLGITEGGAQSSVPVSEPPTIEAEKTPNEQKNANSSELFKGNLLESFTVDNSTFSRAQVRATFYQNLRMRSLIRRTRMIEMVSKGLATMEVSLKHSGSLFMYAGHAGGAYAKNSFGNIYTAVGVFVLGRMFREAWGSQASKKQAEFNEFLERNRMCISMELVTAVLGDHGQRPQDDYVVMTAVTELGNGKPKFYSTPDVIAFCREWRLPTNHVWLFSTRKSVTSFFDACDALCEEGTATPVCQALDEVADISVPEGLDLGPTLREICAANRPEKQQIKALLQSAGTAFCPNYLDWFGDEDSGSHSRDADGSVLTKFLQAHSADLSTRKLKGQSRIVAFVSRFFR